MPYLIEKQFSSQKKRVLAQSSQQHSPNKRQSHQKPKLFDYVKLDELSNLVNKACGNSKRNLDFLGCYAFIQAEGFCYRNNNLAVYAESNKQVEKKNALEKTYSL